MITFDKIEVEINGTGFIADSATLSSNNELQEQYTLGKKGILDQALVGGLTNSLSLSYYIDLNEDPISVITRKLKNLTQDGTYSPPSLVFGDISGHYYLTSHSIQSVPNSPVKASASFINYDGVSGDLASKNYSTLDEDQEVAHSWGVKVQSVDGYRATPTYTLDYSFNADWLPTYKIGKTNPIQTNLIKGKETLDLVRDEYTFIQFSGQPTLGSLLENSPNQIDIISLDVLCDGGDLDNIGDSTPTSSYLNLDFSGAVVSNSELFAGVDDIVRIKTTSNKYF